MRMGREGSRPSCPFPYELSPKEVLSNSETETMRSLVRTVLTIKVVPLRPSKRTMKRTCTRRSRRQTTCHTALPAFPT